MVCLGDAVHPVSPYAVYGMGMAIEDGFFLAKFIAGKNLGDRAALTEGFRDSPCIAWSGPGSV